MQIPRNVIVDLLPVYMAGEVSDETRAIVDDFLKTNPEFSRLVRNASTPSLLPQGAVFPADRKKETLALTKRLIAHKTWALVGAILFTVVPFSMMFQNGRLVWMMVRDSQLSALIYFFAAAFCWLKYIRLKDRLRVSGI